MTAPVIASTVQDRRPRVGDGKPTVRSARCSFLEMLHSKNACEWEGAWNCISGFFWNAEVTVAVECTAAEVQASAGQFLKEPRNYSCTLSASSKNSDSPCRLLCWNRTLPLSVRGEISRTGTGHYSYHISLLPYRPFYRTLTWSYFDRDIRRTRSACNINLAILALFA